MDHTARVPLNARCASRERSRDKLRQVSIQHRRWVYAHGGQAEANPTIDATAPSGERNLPALIDSGSA